MGRFFKAQEVELNKNNIYVPPFAAMAASLDNANTDYETNMNNIDLGANVDIKHLEYDRERAIQQKKDIQDKADEITQKLQKNPLSPQNKFLIKKFSQEIKNNYDTGNIYKMRQSALNDEKFKKELEDNTTLSSLLKENSKNITFKNYTDNNPEGSYSSIYTPGSVINDVPLVETLTKAWKDLPDQEKKKTFEKLGYQYNTTTTHDEKVKVYEGWAKNYILSSPKLYETLQQQSASPIFADRKLLDATGNLNFEPNFTLDEKGNSVANQKAGHLGDVLNAIDYLKENNTNDVVSYSKNEFYDTNEAKKASIKSGMKDSMNAYVGTGRTTQVTTNEEIAANSLETTIKMDAIRKAYKMPIPTEFSTNNLYGVDIKQKFEKSYNDPKTTPSQKISLAKALVNLRSIATQVRGRNVSAGYAEFADVTSPEIAAAAEIEINKKMEDIPFLNSLDGLVVLGEGNFDKNSPTLLKDAKGNLLKGKDGKYIDDPNFKRKNLEDYLKDHSEKYGFTKTTKTTAFDGTVSITRDDDFRNKQQKAVVKGSAGIITMKNNPSLSRIEFQMVDQDGHIERMSFPFKNIAPQIQF